MTITTTRRGGQPATWLRILRTCGCDDPQNLDPIGKVLLITRACVQPMTLTSVAIAGLLAARSSSFDGLWFGLSAIGSVVAHAANNMINDYFDLTEGLDDTQYPRAEYAPHPVLSGATTKRGLKRAILAANAIDASIMIVLAAARGWPIVAFAVAGLSISVFYVAPPLRLKARGLGEPSVALIWGPVMVGGTYYAAVGRLPSSVLLASIPYACLVTTVLMGKHIDKMPWDSNANIRTLPVILGNERSRQLTVLLMGAFYVSIAGLALSGSLDAWALIGSPHCLPSSKRHARFVNRSLLNLRATTHCGLCGTAHGPSCMQETPELFSSLVLRSALSGR
ncbi:MAG: 1,4-dihydroxy-2-naphthoate polyprenyltransferase [Actinomycetota bacterium]|nr:1,4-dihydroxy-2-naphthoate polyprenyltransferase [Actinomycetota bacterium]